MPVQEIEEVLVHLKSKKKHLVSCIVPTYC